MGSYFCGLDLGQAQDYSALVAVEQQWEESLPVYSVPYIKRWPLRTSYPAIVEDVQELLRKPPLLGAQLVVDHTGVGRAVVDLFRFYSSLLVPVTITGGNTVTEYWPFAPAGWQPSEGKGGYGPTGYGVPKRDLVGVVSVLLQNKRLKIAAELPEAKLLTNELLQFKVTLSATGHDSYGVEAPWREGNHDDLVLALAIALWRAEQRVRAAGTGKLLVARGKPESERSFRSERGRPGRRIVWSNRRGFFFTPQPAFL